MLVDGVDGDGAVIDIDWQAARADVSTAAENKGKRMATSMFDGFKSVISVSVILKAQSRRQLKSPYVVTAPFFSNAIQ
jgi:hypothetical protein